MNEEWRDIKGYEGLYQVSNQGRIRSLDKVVNARNGSKQLRKGRILKAGISDTGYYTVALCKNGKQKTHLVHRLVASAFLPNPDSLHYINHKDEYRTNNHYLNLEWCTQKYNMEYSNVIEKRKKPVIQLTKELKFIAEFESAVDAERKTKVSRKVISRVCLGQGYTAGGYVWKFK